ncbi:MAG: hypothetical protein IPK26_06780 [Planctomycetes bacterium]|nr:hypothetical protein [Planctomycetota bacterium]
MLLHSCAPRSGGPRRLVLGALRFLFLVALVAALPAQPWLGFARSCNEVSAFSRNDLGNLAGEALTRLDSREHAGWGTAIAGFRTVSGVAFASTSGVTPQTIDLLFYPESGVGTELPAAAPVTFALGVPIPPGPVCAMTIVGPPVSVPIAGSGDVFLSFRLPAAPFPGWPTDGVGIGIVAGYPGVLPDDFVTPLTNFDRPGPNATPGAPTLLPTGTYGLRKLLGAGYRLSRQHWFDLRHQPWGASTSYEGAGGVGIVWNNQVNYPTGIAGTSNFLSGTSPNSWPSLANGNPATRSDDIGMGIQMAGLSGQIVVFVAQVAAGFGPEIPITLPPVNAPPLSTGVLCLNVNSPLHVVIAFGASNDTAEVRYPVNGGAWLAGLPVVQQAFAFDVTTGLIHASPCDWLRF